MRFILFTEEDKKRYGDVILKMLRDGDNDFVPPLSCRSSTTQKELSASAALSGVDGIKLYFDEMIKQNVFACIEGDKLLGFVSFRENYICEQIDETSLPNIYLSTLIVSPEARGRGLTKKMYLSLFDELYAEHNIFTRTWSTNDAHIAILGKFGFCEIARLKNHRGTGIDTVYFAKMR